MSFTSSDSLLKHLYDWAPFLLLLATLAGSVGAARLLHLALTRSTRLQRTHALAASVLLGITVFLGVVIAWSAGAVVPDPGPRPFTPETWASRPWDRWAMAQDIVDSDRLIGMTREQVESLLVGRDGSYNDPPGSSQLDYDAWMLYRPRDMFIPFPPELVVRYDSDSGGRVVHVFIWGE
jgi:hypothetical protein